MPRYSINTITRLKEFRKRGYSIHALVAEFSIPKTSIWHHIHNIKLSKKSLLKIKANQGGSRLKREKEILKAREEAKRLIDSRNGIIYAVIAMLYWAEGSKRRCEFVNTDGEMIRLYLKIIRNYLKIPDNRIQPVLRIFTNHDKNKSLRYWSMITGMPKKRFKISLNDGGTSGRTPYGMCRVIVLKGGYPLKLFKALAVELCQR